MMADYAYLVQMDIPEELDAEFNRVYDTEHARYLCNAAGVHSCHRYRLEAGDGDGMARYAALYAVDNPGVPASAGWQVEGAKGEWAGKIRPQTSNRTHTMLRRIAAAGDDAADAGYVFIVRTDIAAEVEAEFNRLYDAVHLPGLCQVDGVVGARRYRVESTNAPGGAARYLAVYRIESPAVVGSGGWQAAVQDEWTAKVRHRCIGLTRTTMRQVARHTAPSPGATG